MTIQPYLFFEGRAEEAAEFYREAVGAEIQMMMRNSESPDPHPPGMLPPGAESKIMHMSLKIGDAVIGGSDGHCSGKPDFRGFRLTFLARDAAHAETVFNALSRGGKVAMPLTQTFFSPRFGMVDDRFGLGWMIMVLPPHG